MLYVSEVVCRGKTIQLVTNTDQCEICRRSRVVCTEAPWRDHEFQPATARAEAMPESWLLLPRIHRDEARHHRTIPKNQRLENNIIPVNQGRLPL